MAKKGRKKEIDLFHQEGRARYIKDEKIQTLLRNFFKKGFAEEEYYKWDNL